MVGIPAKNEEATIIHVMDIASQGLMEYFYDYDSLLVVADGGSTDRTADLAGSFRVPPHIDKVTFSDSNMKGKGDAVRAILETAVEVDATMVAIVDSDLMSIRPVWIDRLLRPIAFGDADYVVPRYLRDKWDGGITKLVTYPMISTLFGKEIRQPMGGEIALTRELVDKCLEHPLFPPDFGIDTFITMVALANNFRVGRALLGAKLHESTAKYASPGKHLLPMFHQVVRSLFEMMENYEWAFRQRDVFLRSRRSPLVLSKYKGIRPTPTEIDLESFWADTVEILSNQHKNLSDVLGNKLASKIERLVKKKKKREGLDSDTWAEVLFRFAAAYKRKKDPALIDLLGGIWLLRYVGWMQETKPLTLAETEDLVYAQMMEFLERRSLLLKIY